MGHIPHSQGICPETGCIGLRFSALTMNSHIRMARAALLLVSVEAATMLDQPFPERRAFHRLSPVPDCS
jgi:hypothetical protein